MFFQANPRKRRHLCRLTCCYTCLGRDDRCRPGYCSRVANVPPALLCIECARRPGRRGPPPTHLFCGLPGHRKPGEQTFLALLREYIPGFGSIRLSAPLGIHFTGRRARLPRRRSRRPPSCGPGPSAPDAGPSRAFKSGGVGVSLALSASGLARPLNPLAPAFVTAQPPVVPVFHPPDAIPAQLPRQPRQAPPLTLAPSAGHVLSTGRHGGAPLGSVGPSRDGSGCQPHASVVRRRGPHPPPALGSVSRPPGSASGSAAPPTQPAPGPARQPKLQPSVPSQPAALGSAWGVCVVPRCRAQPCNEPLHRKGAMWRPSCSLSWGALEEDSLRSLV